MGTGDGVTAAYISQEVGQGSESLLEIRVPEGFLFELSVLRPHKCVWR